MRVRDVGLESFGGAPLRCGTRHDAAGRGLVGDIGEPDPAATFRQRGHDARTDSPRTASDEDHVVLESLATFIFRGRRSNYRMHHRL